MTVLTVGGGHSLAIIGKSGQCHIKVGNYLRKHHALNNKTLSDTYF